MNSKPVGFISSHFSDFPLLLMFEIVNSPHSILINSIVSLLSCQSEEMMDGFKKNGPIIVKEVWWNCLSLAPHSWDGTALVSSGIVGINQTLLGMCCCVCPRVHMLVCVCVWQKDRGVCVGSGDLIWWVIDLFACSSLSPKREQPRLQGSAVSGAVLSASFDLLFKSSDIYLRKE